MVFNVQVFFDLLGEFFFAMSGCLLAARKRFNIIGSLLLGSVAGLGGGVVRDLFIGLHIPAAFSNPLYLIPPVLSTLIVYFLFDRVRDFQHYLVIFDASGLALFSVTGTIKSLDFGLNPASSILLGVAAAIGGGVLRDVIAREVPTLFNSRDIYAVPAFLGAIVTMILFELTWLSPIMTLMVMALVFMFRVLAWRRRWRVPLAVWGLDKTAKPDADAPAHPHANRLKK